jgi:hypothetical protein
MDKLIHTILHYIVVLIIVVISLLVVREYVMVNVVETLEQRLVNAASQR